MIRIDGHLGVFQKHPQPGLAFRRVGQRLTERVARQQVHPLALLFAPVEKRVHRRGAALAPPGQLRRAVELLLANLLLVPVQRPDERQRRGHALRIALPGIHEITPAMTPALRMREAAALRERLVRTVPVAQQRAREIPEEPLHVLVRAARRVVKHQFVVLPVHRPEVRRAHLARPAAPGLDRGLVHGHDRAAQDVRRLRPDHRRQQIDGPSGPVRQTAPTHRDPAVGQAPVLAVQRQVIAELVHQQPGQETHVHRRAPQHVRRRRRRQHLRGVPALDDLAHVPQHLVTARLLGQPVRDLLPHDLPLARRYRLDSGIRHMDRLHRHRLVEPQPVLVDRPVAALLPAPIANLLRRDFPLRRRLDAQRREQARLLRIAELKPLLGLRPEQLALEPLQLMLDVGQLPGEVGDGRVQSRVLLFKNLDPSVGQGVRTRRR